MLLCQDRRGDEDSDLHALLDRLEGGSDCDLRLAVAHISADQAVHDPPALHIPLRILDGCQLVLSLLKGKHLFQLPLPDRVFSINMSLPGLALCVQFHKVIRDLLDGFLHAAAGAGPLLCSEFIEFWLFGPLRRRIFLKRRQLSGHNKKYAACAVLDLQIVSGDMLHNDLFHAPVDPDAILLVNDIIAYLELGKFPDLLPAVIAPDFFLFLFLLSKDLRFCQHGKSDLRIGKTPAHSPREGHDFTGQECFQCVLPVKRRDSVCRQILGQTFCPRAGGRYYDRTFLLSSEAVELLPKFFIAHPGERGLPRMDLHCLVKAQRKPAAIAGSSMIKTAVRKGDLYVLFFRRACQDGQSRPAVPFQMDDHIP